MWCFISHSHFSLHCLLVLFALHYSSFTIFKLISFLVPMPCSAACLRPHRIVQYSHCICNSFLYPSYWVSFEPVSQGVCQIWTLHFSIFLLLPSSILNEFSECDRHSERATVRGMLSPHNAWKTTVLSHKDLILLMWNCLLKCILQDLCTFFFIYLGLMIGEYLFTGGSSENDSEPATWDYWGQNFHAAYFNSTDSISSGTGQAWSLLQ